MIRVNSTTSVNKARNLLLSNNANSAKNIAKKMDLPSKVMLASLGIMGSLNGIQEPDELDKFEMKCSDYNKYGSDPCWADYACPIAFP